MDTQIISAEPLTPDEMLLLVDSETIIKIHLHAFFDVGHALMQIRVNKLYRVTHPTFEQYCNEKWRFTKSRANQLIAGAEVADNLATTVAISERAIRPLAILPPKEQKEVFQKAVETAPDGKVTAKHVEETVMKKTKTDQTETHSGPSRISASFKVACDAMAEEIRRENLAGWQQTEKQVAIEYIQKLLDMIGGSEAQSDAAEDGLKEKAGQKVAIDS
jgi:hypothetical protein